MNGLGGFIACFILVSAAASLVNSVIQVNRPGRIAWETFRFTLMIVFGILAFSALVFLLEWIFIPR